MRIVCLHLYMASSPTLTPATFGVPTLSTPTQARGLERVIGHQPFMLFAIPCITARVAMQSDKASCAFW